MSVMEAGFFDAFRSIGGSDEKARAAAQALSKRDPEAAALKADVASLKFDVGVLKTDVAALKGDVATLKGDVATLKVEVALLKWMMGFCLALEAAILLKLLVR
jgi:hypothetical protein